MCRAHPFIDTQRYVRKATKPCVLPYVCVRIRWLVRFSTGLYRLPATAHQWSGLVARSVLVRCMSAIQSGLFLYLMVVVRRAPSGAPGLLIPPVD